MEKGPLCGNEHEPLMRLSGKAASRMGHSQPASGLVDLEPTLSIHSVEYVYILCAYQCVNVQACAVGSVSHCSEEIGEHQAQPKWAV